MLAAITANCEAGELSVPSDGSIVATDPLDAGKWYVIEARGTYGYRDVVPEKIADAEWAYSWLDGDWIENPGGGDLDLHVDGADISMMGTQDGVTFGPHVYSPAHIYRAAILGDGTPIELSIYDDRYDDNTGGLQVTLRPATIGDTNVDDIVDRADYANLIAQFGGPPGEYNADFNGDGIVNLADFAIQRANVGITPASAPRGLSGSAVPEPGTLVVLTSGLILLPRRRRPGGS